MKQNKIWIGILCLLICIVGGCSKQYSDSETSQDTMIFEGMNCIYEETISPNKEYAESEEEIVYYVIKVYQDQDHTVYVHAASNSLFFEEMQYEVEYENVLSESDIQIEWTTLMGNTEASSDDSLGVATVSIFQDGEIINQRKINFIEKGLEKVFEALEENKKKQRG